MNHKLQARKLNIEEKIKLRRFLLKNTRLYRWNMRRISNLISQLENLEVDLAVINYEIFINKNGLQNTAGGGSYNL
jgi:hypothetical protein